MEELRLNSKRILLLGGLCALAGYFYIKTNHHHHTLDREEGDSERDVVEREVVEVPESLECIVCMTGVKEVLLEPCGHVCLCRDCAERMRLPSGRVKCPVCRIRAETRTVFIT